MADPTDTATIITLAQNYRIVLGAVSGKVFERCSINYMICCSLLDDKWFYDIRKLFVNDPNWCTIQGSESAWEGVEFNR